MNKIIFLFLAFLISGMSFAGEALPYNFLDTKYIPIKMSPMATITSDGENYEGQEIKFKVRNNVICYGTMIVKKGTIVTGRIETIITKGMNGFPAEIVLNNFKIDGINETQLVGEYTKTGKNFALLVYPIKWALTPIPFVGSLTNLIHGTEARIDGDDIITIKYYPHWK